MTALINSGQVASAAWLAVVWLFLIAVVGSTLLIRWRRLEQEDAEETTRVMASLKPDTTHLHEMDAL